VPIETRFGDENPDPTLAHGGDSTVCAM
jgi:hypothetical protein